MGDLSQHNGRESTIPIGSGPRPNSALGPAYDDQSDLSLGDLLGTVWRRLWIILVITILFAGSALGFSLLQTPTYEASAKLLVGQEREEGSVPNDLQGNLKGLGQVSKTMVEAVRTRPVAQAIDQKLDLGGSPGTIQQNLSAKEIPDTQFLQVSYKDSSPERAQLVANTVGDAFSEQVSEVTPQGYAITVVTWEQAAMPGSPVSPDPVRNVLLALALGLMIGVGLAFLLEYLDDKLRSPEEVEQVSGVPTVGVIPAFRGPKER